jgi:hypothetical protein
MFDGSAPMRAAFGGVLLLAAACTVLGSSLDRFNAGGDCDGGPCGECAAGQELCAGACVDTSSNQNHCGSCDNACEPGQVCAAGVCKIACPGGQSECAGLCYNLLDDVDHCGSCGKKCLAGEVCDSGSCASTCSSGQQNCGGSCVDLQTSATHCGACGNACDPQTEECSGGECVVACKTLLNQGMADPWGYHWDGLERAASTFSEAQATCTGFNGRLPTASELHRVSATQSATVGQTIHTNYLWSLVPHSADSHIQVRLSDAQTGSQADSSALNYRCVCPPPLPKAFVGSNCFMKTAGQNPACYALGGDGNKYNFDLHDRAVLSKGAAIWECAFHRAHLPTPLQYAEAILQGIGAGSDQWLHTADEVHQQYNAVVRWTDPASWVFQYTGAGNALSWGDPATFRPFRCVGPNVDAGPYKGEASDSELADWITAHDTCISRGAHLPRATELGELIIQGLPAGSGNWLWTSDQNGYYADSGFLVSVKRWTGVELMHQYAHPTDLSWDYRTSSYGYRCISYPIDSAYAGPQAADCAGGCFTLTLPGDSGAKLWLDSSDRAPATNVLDAIDTCQKRGGHLASERDLTEAIRKGLPNGSGQWIHTTDLGVGSGSALNVGVVVWSETDTAFSDQYPTHASWSDPLELRPYRCMWTNELR